MSAYGNAPLTWREVSGPKLDGLDAMARLLSNATTGFDKTLQRVEDTRQAGAVGELLKRSLNLTTPEEIQAAQQSGQLTQGIDPRYITPEFVKTLDARISAAQTAQHNAGLLEYNKSRLDLLNQDLDFRKEQERQKNKTFQDQEKANRFNYALQQAIDSGDPERIKQFASDPVFQEWAPTQGAAPLKAIKAAEGEVFSPLINKVLTSYAGLNAVERDDAFKAILSTPLADQPGVREKLLAGAKALNVNIGDTEYEANVAKMRDMLAQGAASTTGVPVSDMFSNTGAPSKFIGKAQDGSIRFKVDPAFAARDADNTRRLTNFVIPKDQDNVLEQVGAGNPDKINFLRTVLAIENRGFGKPTNAVSPKGAGGAFQFMPKTGLDFGLNPEDRTDFGKSAVAAGKFYDMLHKKYNGNQLAMLAYYNGGHPAALAVLNGQQAPVQETRNYVEMGKALGLGTASQLVGKSVITEADANAAKAANILAAQVSPKLDPNSLSDTQLMENTKVSNVIQQNTNVDGQANSLATKLAKYDVPWAADTERVFKEFVKTSDYEHIAKMGYGKFKELYDKYGFYETTDEKGRKVMKQIPAARFVGAMEESVVRGASQAENKSIFDSPRDFLGDFVGGNNLPLTTGGANAVLNFLGLGEDYATLDKYKLQDSIKTYAKGTPGIAKIAKDVSEGTVKLREEQAAKVIAARAKLKEAKLAFSNNPNNSNISANLMIAEAALKDANEKYLEALAIVK